MPRRVIASLMPKLAAENSENTIPRPGIGGLPFPRQPTGRTQFGVSSKQAARHPTSSGYMSQARFGWVELDPGGKPSAEPVASVPVPAETPASKATMVSATPSDVSIAEARPAVTTSAPSESLEDEQPASTEEAMPAEPEALTYGAPIWMNIPRIKVDSRVMDVGVKHGEFEVPEHVHGRASLPSIAESFTECPGQERRGSHLY
jgi:hypothetical protein